MSEARRHHYVPRYHLRGYADGNERLHRLDLIEGRSIELAVANAAVERDYYRIEGIDEPNLVEDAYSKIESRAAAAVAEVHSSLSFPSKEGLLDILDAAASQATRGPATRDLVQSFEERAAKIATRMTLSTTGGYVAALRRIGAPVPDADGVEEERLELLGGLDQLRLEVDPARMNARAMNMAGTVLEWLCKRRWTLLHLEPDAGHLITSDNPVVLIPRSGTFPAIGNVGFGLQNTAVLMPLSRSMALIGVFEGSGGSVHRIGVRQVAAFNAAVAAGAHRYLFSLRPTFRFMWGTEIQTDWAMLRRAEDTPR